MWWWLGCAPVELGPVMLLDRYGAPVAALDSEQQLFVGGLPVGALRDGVWRRQDRKPPVVLLIDGVVPEGAGPDETQAVRFESREQGLALPSRQVEVDGQGQLSCRGQPCGRFEPPGPPGERHAALLAAVYMIDRYRGVEVRAHLRAENGPEDWRVTMAGLPSGELAEAPDCALPTGDETCRGERLGHFVGDQVTLPSRELRASELVDPETCAVRWRDLQVKGVHYPVIAYLFQQLDSPFGPLVLNIQVASWGRELDCHEPEAKAALAAASARLAEEYERDLPQ
jgi:hypothetical protein